MTKTVEEAMALAKPAQENATASKEAALVAARAMIGEIQAAVLKALDGTTLMGLPNLGTSRDTYHAVNVRGADPARKFWRGDNKPTLVIARTGELQVVTFGRDEIVYEDVDFEKLGAGDLQAVAERYKLALDLHLARCRESVQRSEEIVSLARAIAKALESRRGPEE